MLAFLILQRHLEVQVLTQVQVRFQFEFMQNRKQPIQSLDALQVVALGSHPLQFPEDTLAGNPFYTSRIFDLQTPPGQLTHDPFEGFDIDLIGLKAFQQVCIENILKRSSVSIGNRYLII
jgi:hypothetical protein